MVHSVLRVVLSRDNLLCRFSNEVAVKWAENWCNVF